LKPTSPLPLHHSWPLAESGQRFDLGYLFGADALRGFAPASLDDEMLAAHGIGRWSCTLHDNSLDWTDPVFDLFGLPRGAHLSRDETVALYCEESRAAMERLRAYGIKHRRGFTVDAEIVAVGGRRRWMRLLAAPVSKEGRVVRLQGLKQDISHLYW
jgi:PAS domain-containing protein